MFKNNLFGEGILLNGLLQRITLFSKRKYNKMLSYRRETALQGAL